MGLGHGLVNAVALVGEPTSTPFSIESALDAYVLDESEDRPPDGKWHPSSMFGCERKAIYQVRGVPEDGPISARLRRIFFLGTNFHQITQTRGNGSARPRGQEHQGCLPRGRHQGPAAEHRRPR